jgi:RNA recognition motif-containing protein
MAKKLYVGNLSYGVTNADLENMFSPHGTIRSAEVIIDRATGQGKGFGFVEMESDQDAQAAISALDGKEHEGRSIKVNEAKPREPRTGSGSYGGGGGYGGSRNQTGGGSRSRY